MCKIRTTQLLGFTMDQSHVKNNHLDDLGSQLKDFFPLNLNKWLDFFSIYRFVLPSLHPVTNM